jgi:Tol biopolymer transport system component
MKVRTQLTNNENRKRTNMKLLSVLAVVFALMLVVASSAYAQPRAGVLFQSGLYQEQVKGDLDAAIKVYERIIVKFPKDRHIVAKALLHIGLCYEKLGTQEAQKTYRHLIKEYADQLEPVAQARARLAALGQLPSGMVVRRVRADCPLFNMFRGISPDGRYISHADLESGDLAIHELATGQNRVLTNEGSEWQEFTVEHIFSPDGQQLAFNWYRKDASLELRIIGLDGSKPRTLYHNPEVGYLAPRDWSPDGRQILAILGRKDAGVEIALISVADGSVRALKTALSEVGGLRFSPDGRYIVYESPSQQDSSKSDIFVLASDASREMALVEHPANDSVLGWSPDGRHILFSSDRRGATDAWLIPVSDGKADGPPELLIPNIGPIEPMGFTRDGAFYYHTQTALKDVYTAEVDLKGGKNSHPPQVRQRRGRRPQYGPRVVARWPVPRVSLSTRSARALFREGR